MIKKKIDNIYIESSEEPTMIGKKEEREGKEGNIIEISLFLYFFLILVFFKTLLMSC